VTRFHYGVVLAGSDTSWLSLRRTRIFANPFAFSVVGHTPREEIVERFRDRPNDTFTSFQNGPTVGLWGVRGGWEIVDCDLYGAYITISTHHNQCDGESDPGVARDRSPAWFGRVSNSRIRYGDGVAIMADSAKQLVVEDCIFGGASLASMQMMDISTYEDTGYAQHLFFARNDFGGQLGGTQGGDGEGMNFDALNGGGASYDGRCVCSVQTLPAYHYFPHTNHDGCLLCNTLIRNAAGGPVLPTPRSMGSRCGFRRAAHSLCQTVGGAHRASSRPRLVEPSLW
jgi:hypothetical protein